MATTKTTTKAQNTKAINKEEKVMKNSAKKNQTVEEILSISELRGAFIEAGIVPKFCDNKHYVGCGVRANVFSVNALKTRYNVYCSDEVFGFLQGHGIDNAEFIEDGNKQDKTRNNLVEVTTTKSLKEMLGVVKKNLAGVAI